MNKTILALLLIAAVASCKKKDNQPGVIPHIKGRLVEHCSSMKPMANYNLYVTQKNEWGMKVRDVGVDTTDAQGYFDIACPGLLETPIKLEHRIDETNANILFSDIQLSTDVRKVGDDYDFATIYYRGAFGSNVRVEIANDHPLTDSLYVGTPSNIVVIHPMNKGVYSVYTGYDVLGGGISDTAYFSYNFTVLWGIGKKDYDSANNAVRYPPQASQYHVIISKCYPCSPSNTSLFVQ